MAVVKFVNYQRGQTRHGMGAVMRYTAQDKKTLWEERQLVTGINCQPQTVYGDFMTTKSLYHKTDGVMFFHMVQSFPKGEEVDAATAHAAALELAQYYKGHEVLVCTHTDRDHIHSHFIINSVNFDTGRKLHIAREQLQELRQLNDQVCLKYDLPVFQAQPCQRKAKSMTTAEYHMAKNGQSKKMQLMYIIRDCMRHASNRDEFIALMESEGYQVRWENNRRSITYTAPDGWKCRDNKLFEDRFLKENMEYEFEIRNDLIHGRASGTEPSDAYEPAAAADYADTAIDDRTRTQLHRDPVSAPGSDGAVGEPTGAVGDPEFLADGVPESADGGARFTSHQSADGRAVESDDAPESDGRTGWEAEREAFFSSGTQTAKAAPDTSATTGRSGVVPPSLVSGGAAVALGGMGALMELDSSGEDPEEVRKRIAAKVEAENFGAAVGVAIGVVSAMTEHLTEQKLPERPEGPEIPESEVLEPDESQDFRWEQSM